MNLVSSTPSSQIQDGPPSSLSSSLVLQHIEGAGEGYICTARISRREVILREKIHYVLSRNNEDDSIFSASARLAETLRRHHPTELDRLYSGNPNYIDQVRARLTTANLGIAADKLPQVSLDTTRVLLNQWEEPVTRGRYMLYLGFNLSKTNHSCKPNAERKLSVDKQFVRLVALRKISPGDQITVTYFGRAFKNRSRKDQKEHLLKDWQFKCTCLLCGEERDAQQSDRRRDGNGVVRRKRSHDAMTGQTNK